MNTSFTDSKIKPFRIPHGHLIGCTKLVLPAHCSILDLTYNSRLLGDGMEGGGRLLGDRMEGGGRLLGDRMEGGGDCWEMGWREGEIAGRWDGGRREIVGRRDGGRGRLLGDGMEGGGRLLGDGMEGGGDCCEMGWRKEGGAETHEAWITGGVWRTCPPTSFND